MPVVIIVILALLLPRLSIFLLWLLTDWFDKLSVGFLLPLLGFFFMPYTLLWYSATLHLFPGVWGPLEYLGLILAILSDLSSNGFGYRRYSSHYHVVEHVEEDI